MTQDIGQWRTLANTVANLGIGKGKVRPRSGLKGPEGERYSSTLSLTAALYGVGGECHAPAALPPGKRSITPRTGDWVAPRACLDACGKSRLPLGSDPRTVQAVASRYSDYAIP